MAAESLSKSQYLQPLRQILINLLDRFMQHPKKQERLLKALSRQGLTVSYNNNVYKPIQPVISAQVEAGMVQEVARLQPILTFKA